MRRLGLALLAEALSPSSAWACAVCFGKSDNGDIGRAYTLGIFVLASFTFLILGALGYAMYRIEVRRAKVLDETRATQVAALTN